VSEGLSADVSAPSGVERIAVLRANALGDFVFTLPALAALRARFPAAHLTLLGREWHREFVAGRPEIVDDVAVLPPVPGLTAPPDDAPDAAWPTWLAAQRERRYDLAVQLHGGGRVSNPVVRALGARLSVGLHAPDAEPLDRSLPYVYYQNEVVRLLEVVGLAGATGEPYPRLRARPSDRTQARPVLDALRGEPYVVLHPGATDPRRRWAPQHFAAVADWLAERGIRVVVTGTTSEASVTGAVVDAARSDVLDATGAVSLAGLVGLLAGAQAVVSNDTGPLHLADALGRPTVGIFWCGNLINGGPLRRGRHRPLPSWTVHCPQCGLDCTRDLYPARTGGQVCRHSVSFVDDVAVVEALEALDALLAAPLSAAAATRLG
jgi:ADP-heptose:LPS heptosyltransferase